MCAYMAQTCRALRHAKSGGLAQAQQIVRHSHIGARPIPLPADVSCSWHRRPGTPASESMLRFVGPRGVREVSLPEGISPALQSSNPKLSHSQEADVQSSKTTISQRSTNTLIMECRDSEDSFQRSNWGLTAALVANCVQGVSGGSTLDIHLVGVGYRASIEQPVSSSLSSSSTSQAQVLVLRLGYPRPIRVAIPPDMQCEVFSPTEIKFTGNDNAALAQLAAKIRSLRPPEPYNGKGVFVGKETIQRKEVKKK